MPRSLPGQPPAHELASILWVLGQAFFGRRHVRMSWTGPLASTARTRRFIAHCSDVHSNLEVEEERRGVLLSGVPDTATQAAHDSEQCELSDPSREQVLCYDLLTGQSSCFGAETIDAGPKASCRAAAEPGVGAPCFLLRAEVGSHKRCPQLLPSGGSHGAQTARCPLRSLLSPSRGGRGASWPRTGRSTACPGHIHRPRRQDRTSTLFRPQGL